MTMIRLTAAGLVLAGTLAAGADDAMQPASLSVKARISSMEQINVTAENPVDESAPAASADVAELLAELEQLTAEETPAQ